MRLPVGIDLLTLLLKVSVGREFIMADLWSCIHGILGSVEHEQIRVRARLEVFPGNRDIFFTDPEDATTGDHQLGNLAGLRTHHDVIDTAESLIVWSTHVSTEQLIRSE